ncbi:MAG: hypothetical protein ACE5EB_05720 [Thermodesulfobacteriota bacterium]
MKNRLMRIILVIAALLLAYPYMTEARGAGLREGLVKRDTIKALYTVDDTHSFVIAKSHAISFTRDSRVVKRYSGEKGLNQRAYLIEHSPEPFVYKNPVVPGFARVAGLKDGVIKLREDILNTDRHGYSAVDTFQHAYAVCRKKGGAMTFVIPKQYGSFKRLTRVGAVEAFDHILLNGAGGAWYISCEGDSKFRILKNYSFLTGNAEVAEIRNKVGLESVNYARDEAKEKLRIASLVRRPLDEAVFLENTALELALLKTNFVKPNGGTRYYGTYKKSGLSGCNSVSISRRVEGNGQRNISRVVDYSVCGGRVAMTGEREIDEGPAVAKRVYVSSGEITMVLR